MMRRWFSCGCLLVVCVMQREITAQIPVVDAEARFHPGGDLLMNIPLHAVRVADDNGQRRARISPTQVAAWVASANSTFDGSGIRLRFDPAEDFVDLRSTVLNSMTGISDSNWRDARLLGNQIAAGFDGKIVVYFRWGPGSTPTGGAFSWWDYNFVVMPGFSDTFVCGHQNIDILAHEIGHYAGLPHTFSTIFATPADAESYLLNHGGDPSVFDGDGLADTPPDPFISSIQCSSDMSVELGGQIFVLPRENIMSYWDDMTKSLSAMQIQRVRWLTSLRAERGMAMPSNYGVAGALEFDALPVFEWSGLGFNRQLMSGFGLDQWHQDDHLFCGATNTGRIQFGMFVPQAGTFQLSLYATRAPDFGQVQVTLDGGPVLDALDLYAPLVIPTDSVSLGTVTLAAGQHELEFAVVGRHPESTNFRFGLDCLSLQRVSD